MASGFFVTGTDTGVGKSWCSVGLMEKLQQQGFTVAGMKPVASGCAKTADGLRNGDALLLQAQASGKLPYALINPFAFERPIAPHIAAMREGKQIDIGGIVADFQQLAGQVEQVIVEGVGGWRVPLNEQETVADMARALGLPVILVVGLRLGCINHALLTAEAIRNDGCELAGWIANCVEPDITEQAALVATLEARLGTPLLGVVPFLPEPSAKEIARFLQLP